MSDTGKKFDLTIVTLDRELFKDSVYQVSMPTPLGEITILPHHAALVTAVTPGEIRIVVEKGKGILSDNEVHVAVGSGFAEIASNSVTLLTDSAERIDEIDEQRALEAKAAAEKRLLELQKEVHDVSDVAFTDAAAVLARNIARLKVAGRKRRHHRG